MPPESRSARLRVFLVAAAGPLVTGYAAVATLFAVVTVAASRATFTTSGVLRAATSGWLGAHQVPLSIAGAELGALPLLPTIGVVLLVARTASGAVERLGASAPRDAWPVVAVIAGAHAVCGVLLSLISSTGSVGVDPLAGAYYPALIAAAAATAGVARRGGLWRTLVAQADPVALRGLRIGWLALVALLAAGALIVTVGLITSTGTVRELFAANAPGLGSGLGLFLLSVGYLPNAVLAGTAFVAGPGFTMGTLSVGPLEFAGGSLPGLPLLAGLPEQRAGWWPLLLLLPLGVGVLVGWLCRAVDPEPLGRLRAVAVAAVVVALGSVLLAGSAGGRLGGGPFDPLDLRAPLLSLVLAAWIVLPGGVVAWMAGPRRMRVAVIDEPDESDDEPEPDDDELADEPAEDLADYEDETADDAGPEDDAGPGDEDEHAEDEPEPPVSTRDSVDPASN